MSISKKGEQTKYGLLMSIPYNFCSSLVFRDSVHVDPRSSGAWGPTGYTKENLIGERSKQNVEESQRGRFRSVVEEMVLKAVDR